ncbi:MAG: hypothetical protein A2Y33_09500 [Spirochaetes bacterium GWF1_51_8]|nr:MAG: hypothetical protein A2Y33_09500 [Spirochaetes bacterium GWF1_51_8]
MRKNENKKSLPSLLTGKTAIAVYFRIGLLALFVVIWFLGNRYFTYAKPEALKPQTVVFELPFPQEIEEKYEIITDEDRAEYTVDRVFVSGFFCDWNPASEKYRMKEVSPGKWEAVIPVEYGDNQYKFVVYFTGDSPVSQIWMHNKNAAKNLDDQFGGLNSVIEVSNLGEWEFVFNFLVIGFIAVILIYTVLQPLLMLVLRLRLSFGLKMIIMIFLVALLTNSVLIFYNLREKTESMKYFLRETVSLIHLYMTGECVNLYDLDSEETKAQIKSVFDKFFAASRMRIEKDKVSSTQNMLAQITVFDKDLNIVALGMRLEDIQIVQDILETNIASNIVQMSNLSLNPSLSNLVLSNRQATNMIDLYRNFFYIDIINYAQNHPDEKDRGIFWKLPDPSESLIQPLRTLNLHPYNTVLYPIVVEGEVLGYYLALYYMYMLAADMQKNLYTNFLLLGISMLFFVILSLNIGGFISKYLNQLIEWTKHIIRGNFDIEKKIETHDEIEVLAKNFDVLRLTVGANLRDLKLINEVTAVLNTINQIDELYAVFLYFITANFGLGYNRAAIFLIDKDELVGHYAIGMLDTGEVEKKFGSMKNYRDFKLDLREFVADYKNYIANTDSEFLRRLREFKIPKSETSVLWRIVQRNCFQYIAKSSGDESESDTAIRKSLNLTDYLLMPILKGKEAVGVLLVDNIFHERSVKDHDINQLQILLNDFAANLENSYTILNLERLVLERTAELNKTNEALKLKDRVITTDLNIAKRIQQSVLPRKIGRMGALSLDIRYIPMSEVGGDYYDITEISGGVIRVFIADATGHGVQAALITMMIKGEYDRLKNVIASPGELIEKINNGFMLDSRHLSFFFTCMVADIYIKEKKIVFASAGHPAQYILSKGKRTVLPPTGKVAGIIEGSIYQTRETEFKPGDKLLLFTDGLFEEFNPADEELGEDRMCEILTGLWNKSPVELNDAALAEMRKFLDGAGMNDDLTLLCVSFDKDHS